MTQFLLSPDAEDDLDTIKQYLVQQGGNALARHVLMEIRLAIRFLSENPEAGHKRTDLTDEPVKFWSVFSYMIVYDPTMRPLGVARILHSSQNLEKLIQRHVPRLQ